MPSATPLNDARTVVVLRALAGIGDVLCTVPALRSLRAGLPDAHIALLGLPSSRPLLDRFPAYVDELVPFPGFPGIPEVEADVAALPAFFSAMQARRFDVAIQMHGSGFASNPFTALLGAAHATGFHLPGRYRLSETSLPYPVTLPEIRRLTALTTSLGMPETGDHLEWPVTAEDREAARAATGGSLREYAIVHPGAKQTGRRLDPERFGRVVGQLADAGLAVLLTGTPQDAPLTRAVSAASPVRVLDLAGRTSLGALGALVDGASLVVSNDTGISHLAAARRTRSVVVFSTASDPRRWAPLDGELHVAVHPPVATETCEAGDGVEERCLRDGCTRFGLAECAGEDATFPPDAVVTAAVAVQLERVDRRVCA